MSSPVKFCPDHFGHLGCTYEGCGLSHDREAYMKDKNLKPCPKANCGKLCMMNSRQCKQCTIKEITQNPFTLIRDEYEGGYRLSCGAVVGQRIIGSILETVIKHENYYSEERQKQEGCGFCDFCGCLYKREQRRILLWLC